MFRERFRLPGPPPKILGRPRGSPKSPPGVCAPLPGARGEKMPGTARAPKKRKSLRRDSGANWVRFGSPRGVLLEPCWRHFRTSVRKVRPSRNIVFYHVSWGSGSRGDARGGFQKQGPKKAPKKAARARDFVAKTALFGPPENPRVPPGGPKRPSGSRAHPSSGAGRRAPTRAEKRSKKRP